MPPAAARPAGLLLIELLRGNLDSIISCEDANDGRVYLYRTGDYWAAFGRSAFLLSSAFDGLAVVTPLKIKGQRVPLIMASVENRLLEATVGHLSCSMSGHDVTVYVAGDGIDDAAYNVWCHKSVKLF